MSAKIAQGFVSRRNERRALSIVGKRASAACGNARLATDAPIAIKGKSRHAALPHIFQRLVLVSFA
jgi:hypothetical protein